MIHAGAIRGTKKGRARKAWKATEMKEDGMMDGMEEWCVGGGRLYRAANSRRRSARAWRRYPTLPARRARPSTG